MRILHVTHLYRPAVGGAERHIANLSEALVRRGHEVDVYTTRALDHRTWRNALPGFEELDGVNVYRFSSIVRGDRTWRALVFGLRGYGQTQSARYNPFIIWGNGPISPLLSWRLLRRGRGYDLIHVNSLHYAPVSYVYALARILQMPFAVTPFVHITQPDVFDIGFQNSILRKADLVLAMTDLEKEYLTLRGVERERVTVVGSGIDLDQFPQLDQDTCRRRFGIPGEAFLLLFMGRKEEYKGLGTLLAAFAQLQVECPDLYLAAAGAETEHSRELWQRYNGLKRVIQLDRVSEQDKLVLMNACDVFVMPSRGESFGIVFLEAWAVRKPVIAANSGAVASVISDGVDGLLVAPESVSDIVSKILALYRDRRFAQNLATAGYLKVKDRYTVESVTDGIEGAYLRTVRARNNARRWRRRKYN